MIKIIDHKRVELTEDEWRMYKSICKSYDRANFKGESLFEDHFEVSDGIIIFVKPPQKKYSSLEVYCFLISLMTNQHLRLMHKQVDALVAETKKAVSEMTKPQVKEVKLEAAQDGQQIPVEEPVAPLVKEVKKRTPPPLRRR